MGKYKLGRLPPRYPFILNPYEYTRLSKCPRCQKLTHMRKFVLFILIEGWGPLALGKTCRYCTPCELIIAHKNELEDELVGFFEGRWPDVIGNPYIVLGTVEKQRWKKWLGRSGGTPHGRFGSCFRLQESPGA
jgi:hypothetical protein